MKNPNITHIINRIHFRILYLVSVLLILFMSCQKNDPLAISMGGPIKLTASNASLVLKQKDAKKTFSYTWTTGTNKGTGASISYILQIDKKGNKFAHAITLDMGKAIYTKSYNIGEFNDSLLIHWSLQPGIAADFEARTIAVIASVSIKPDTSNVVTISITPYQPVTKELYMVGNASPHGWDISNAVMMTPDTDDPTIFRYQGVLQVGNFKLPVNRNSNWGQDMYMKDLTDPTKMYLHKGGSPDDSQWAITKSGLYKVEVNLLDLTINIISMGGPAYDNIYMVGDATPNGWDIANATPMVQNPDNLYKFTYDGILKAGAFKFPVNRNTDWGQDMFMRDLSDSTKIYLHKGGASDDNKWTIYKAGWYHVLLDLSNNTISYKPLQLYIVGSATSIGWDISNAIQLAQDPNNPTIFTYTGALVAGEFKFPVNRNTDWGQDMYMKTDNTHMYLHKGGSSDDNKWSITDAGNYIITLNVQTLTINIQKH